VGEPRGKFSLPPAVGVYPMKKVIMALVIAASMSVPAFTPAAAQTIYPELFSSHGECQSAIIDIRNGVRKLVGVNVSGGTVSLVCKLVTDGPNKGKYQLIVG
jgi:hypothetical protein